MTSILTVASALFFAILPVANVQGHGHMSQPISRNYYAYTDGLNGGAQTGVPPKEHCPFCVNHNGGVCGITQSLTTNYDDWLDSTGEPMPWISQHTFTAGDIIEVATYLSTHHNGHHELRGCPMGRASTQECFDSFKFEFISDDSHNMPKDNQYPERGYYWGGQGIGSGYFSHSFKIPDDLVGEQVLLQWHYITANSCNPPGYAEYFGGGNSDNAVLDSTFWTPGVKACPIPMQNDGSTSPERFWNCAEVTILPSDGAPSPTPAPVAPVATTSAPVAATPAPVATTPAPVAATPAPVSPTPAPVAATPAPVAPVPTAVPATPRPTNLRTPAPTVKVVPTTPPPTADTCGVEWSDCYKDNDSCCEDLYCDTYEWYAHCRRRADACILEWSGCNDNPDNCCAGLTCKGDSWKSCQK